MLQPSVTYFISYSREDSEFALKLAQDLRAAGAHIWMDQSYHHYNPNLKEYARKNRSNPTRSEKRMWYELLDWKPT